MNALGKFVSVLIILAIALSMSTAQAYGALQVIRRPTVYARDAITGTAVQGASIDLNGILIGTTDSGGLLTITGAYVDPQQLTIRRNGYTTYQTATNIESGKTYTVLLSPVMVFRTDFEKATKRDANRLNIEIPNWFEFGGDGGASMWIEGLDRKTTNVACHSDSRCVGMEVTDITKSRRAQFAIYPATLVGNEYFVSVWLYLPPDWGLHIPVLGGNWYEIVNPIYTDAPSYLPYSAVWISQNNIALDAFGLTLGMRDTSSAPPLPPRTLGSIPNYPLPRGSWFNVQYYVLRDETNGIVRVWINGNLLFDAENIGTKNPSAGYFTVVGKIYYETAETAPHEIWVDDLEIYQA